MLTIRARLNTGNKSLSIDKIMKNPWTILQVHSANENHRSLFTKSESCRSLSSDTSTAATTAEWEQAKPLDEMPTMSPLQMMRNFLPGGKYAKLDASQLMLAFREDLGPVIMLKGFLGKPDFVLTYNPKDFETVLRNEGIWPVRPGLEYLMYHRQVLHKDIFQGVEGLLGSHGEKWGAFRSAVNPILMQSKNIRWYSHKMSQVSKEFIDRILAIRDPQSLEVPGTFEEELNRWTLESVSLIALDKRLGLITTNRDDPTATRLFQSLTDFFTYTSELEFRPSIWKYYKTRAFKNVIKSLDEITNITKSLVDEAIQRLENEREKSGGVEKSENEKSVLEKLIEIDRKIAMVMAMDMLMAGVDTTSSTFTGILLSLAKNPEKQAKLRKEVRHLLPKKDSEFNETDFRNMPYLRACIKESLRVYPVTVANARAQVADVVISGYRVPKGMLVSTPTTWLLRNEDIYPRASEYLPERWLRPSKELENTPECPHVLKASSPFVYKPFGVGPRSCIGRRIVDMELELGIARLIRNFHVEFNYPTENAFRSVLINSPNIPLKFKFSDVKD